MPDSKNPLLQTLLNLVSDQNTLTVHRAVVDFLDGHFEAALLLEQLLYWTPKASRRGGWIAKSYTEWREEIYLTRYAVEKARKYLQKRGLLAWEIRRFKNSPTAFYRLNLDELASQWEAFIHEREAETALGEGGGSEEAEKAPAEINRWSGKAGKAPAEIDRCHEEPSKAPAEISKCPDETPKAPAEISKCSDKTPKAPAEISKPPAEIDRSPAEISKSLTEITTEITQLSINARLQQQASTTRNRRGPAAASSAVAEAELPEEITAGLKAIGWRGPVDDVVRYWQADPDRVENLVWYAQQAGWGGGLLRNALRSGEWPPEFKPGSAADLARWREEAVRLDALTESRPAAPAVTPLADVAGDRNAPNGNGDEPNMWDDEVGTQPPHPDIGVLPPPTPEMRRWWAFAVGQVRAEMSKADFDAWLRPTWLVARRGDDDRLVFVAATANDYAQRWLTERVSKTLERKLAGLAGRPVSVQFVVLEDVHV